jgi:hypothetical protein
LVRLGIVLRCIAIAFVPLPPAIRGIPRSQDDPGTI